MSDVIVLDEDTLAKWQAEANAARERHRVAVTEASYWGWMIRSGKLLLENVERGPETGTPDN